jgi:hypothetical protein
MNDHASRQPSLMHRAERAYAANRYTILFYTLLVTLATGPLLDALGVEYHFVEVLLAVNLAAAVIPFAARGPRRLLLMILVVACVVRFGGAWWDRPGLSTASLAAWSLIALLAVANTLRFVLTAKVVDREHIYAALDAYILFGLFLGVAYWVLESLAPGSLHVATAARGEAFSLPTGMYFSFVTLATLGYGDVVPVSEAARGLAIVEAMMGQLYLAVLIARLVSLYARGEPPRPKADG